MSDVVIRVENLGKQYRIRHQQAERYTALRDVIAQKCAAPFRALFRRNGSPLRLDRGEVSNSHSLSTHNSQPASEDFWALKDVSFDVKRGEVVGIIGRNGAGKSTLLKILSRITEPTEGRVRIKGRVASLLEVGTGFHPELTGRENIFLNGAILGMNRAEIVRKFDEIVTFAEVERFLDTPVKRYSSGMYVRLAFAVAAHLEPEILVVDEVLAVGDSEFQRKCMGKMKDVAANSGRTVLFVSHNLAAVAQLCSQALLISSGRLITAGPSEQVIRLYLTNSKENNDPIRWNRDGSGAVRLSGIQALRCDGITATTFEMGESLTLRLDGLARDAGIQFSVAVQFTTEDGIPVVYAYNQSESFRVRVGEAFTLDVLMTGVVLMPGTYLVNVWFGNAGIEHYDYVRGCFAFDVIQSADIPVSLNISQQLGLIYCHPRVHFHDVPAGMPSR
ncbi:MAG TPA: ABC transporter ATP-binding protein [Methylomirabilota bacterium]|nr:ABC transporter ATP-binding protein [Methylomirabilota bacterium]